jgi:hypothetical protein
MEFSFDLEYGDKRRKVYLFEKPIKVKPKAYIGDVITIIDNDYLYNPKLDLTSMITTPYKYAKWIEKNQQDYTDTHLYFVYVEYDIDKKQPTKIALLNWKDVMDYVNNEKDIRRNMPNKEEFLRLNLKSYYYYYFAHDFSKIRNGDIEAKERFNSLFKNFLPMRNESGVFSIISNPHDFTNDNREKWEITKESIIRKYGIYDLYNIVEHEHLHITCPQKRISIFSENNFEKKILICLE